MARPSESINSLKFVVDKVSFVNKLSLLSKATSDDESPTPGYMYQEICNLTTVCGSYCSDLLGYLVSRLDKRSYHVKLKVLHIMRYVVDNGHSEFRHGLRRHAHGIREATKFGGPPDPLHGNAPYIMVRKEAKELCYILFDLQTEDSDNKQITDHSTTSAVTMGGMGSHACGGLQGFGNTTVQQKSLAESVVGGLRDLAIKVMDPVAPPTVHDQLSSTHRSDRKFNSYKPVQFTEGESAESARSAWSSEMTRRQDVTLPHTARQVEPPQRTIRAHRPGVAGGGWDDSGDEDDNTQNIQQRAPVSEGDCHEEQITDSSKLQVTSDDYAAERHLVTEAINKETLLMKRADIDNFIKRCSSMNCIKVVETIGDLMVKSAHIFQLHGLQLCEAILRTDIVSPDELATACRSALDVCYRSQHGQTKVKARKVIRILEKLCVNPSVISDVIPTAENAINDAITSSDQNGLTTSSLPQTVGTVGTEDDMYMSGMSGSDLITPPFANMQVTVMSNHHDTSDILHQNQESLSSVNNMSNST